MRTSVLIVGGGLAGLNLARRLHLAGVDFHLLEARDRLGGRVLTHDGFDLGPSWFWPGSQPRLAEVVQDLGLKVFAQHDEGDVVFHRMSREAPRRYRGFAQAPQSMRIAGGTGALIAAIAETLPADRLHLSSTVTQVTLDDVVAASVARADGSQTAWTTDHIAFAAPPRLLESTIGFSPGLRPAIVEMWRATPTWMAPHAKFFALYDRPFWREAGLSGSAQSMAGPLVEIHDATTISGAAALFGFVGVSASHRAAIGEAGLARACVDQLAQLFGPDAATPHATLLKDWSADSLTATRADRESGGHPEPGPKRWIDGEWRGRFWLAGSETSASEPGYLAGAIDASDRAADEILENLQRRNDHVA